MKKVKYTFHLSIVVALAITLFSSCERNENIDPKPEPETIFDLDIPEGFLFETTGETTLNLKALNTNGEAFNNLRWQIFTKSPEDGGELIAEGLSDNSGNFTSAISKPLATDSLFIGSNYGGIAGEMMAVKNGVLNYTYQMPAKATLNTKLAPKGSDFITKMTFNNDLQGFTAYRDNNELSAQHSTSSRNATGIRPIWFYRWVYVGL
ncbi:MAG: hypothetical protein U5L09_18505 [Bacteroidales bacterium]|nr:hypothetical protein [Bacteroidales bacterium]